jgi:putative hemolysin
MPKVNMSKSRINKISILLNFILIAGVIIYLFVPFLSNSILNKTFSPLCGIKQLYQGDEYLPAWCLEAKAKIRQVNNNINFNQNTNINVNNNENINTNTNANTQIANPAAVKCVEAGGKLEPYDTAAGTDELCIFPDDSICNEWDYFRGDCQMGKCFKKCDKVGTNNEGWYNSCSDRIIKYEKCGNVEPTPTPTPITTPTPTPTVSAKDLIISAPVADQQLTSPFQVQGRAKTADNKVHVRVKNQSGQSLIEVSGSIKNIGKDGFGDFDLKISYEFSSTKEGFVEVYALNSQGQEINNVSLPVKF